MEHCSSSESECQTFDALLSNSVRHRTGGQTIPQLIIRKRRIHTFGWCGHSTTVREGSLTICKTFTSLAKTLINLQQYEYKIHAHVIRSDLVISCLKVTFILKKKPVCIRGL